MRSALIAKHAAYVGWHAGDGVVKTLRETGAVTRDGKTLGRIFRAALRHRVPRHVRRAPRASTPTMALPAASRGRPMKTASPCGPSGRSCVTQFDVDALFGETITTAEFTPFGPAHPKARRNRLRRRAPGLRRSAFRSTSTSIVQPAHTAGPSSIPTGNTKSRSTGWTYAEAGGKRFLSAWHHGDAKTRDVYTTVEPNAAIAADDLRPPKQTATWTFGVGPRCGGIRRPTGPTPVRQPRRQRRQGEVHPRHRRRRDRRPRLLRSPRRSRPRGYGVNHRHRRQREGEPLSHRRRSASAARRCTT